MSNSTTADILIDTLSRKGVNHCFGIPGDYSLRFYKKLTASGKIKVINTTSELCAGYAADAYARVHGIGMACVTYCVGGYSILNAVAGAYAEKSPVIILSGSPGMEERESGCLLHHMSGPFESQMEVFKKVTCAQALLSHPDRVCYELDRVLMAMHEHSQPVYIELPRDMVERTVSYDIYSQSVPKNYKSDSLALEESLKDVGDYINSASRPVIWAGVEVARYGLSKKLLRFAEQHNIPIVSSVLGKSAVNETHPLSLGVYCESIADDKLKSYMAECDCIIMLGVMMTDMNTGFLPLRYHKRQIVHAASNTLQVRNHSYADVRFQDFMDGFFSLKLKERPFPSNLPKKVKPEYVLDADRKITAKRVFQKIDSIMNDKMAIVSDVGDSLFGALEITVKDHHFISNAFYTSMGFAVPGAVGLQAARPDLRPIVIVGDGAAQMTSVEFSTLNRMKSNAIVFLLNNEGYGTERVLLDGPFNDISNWKYHKLCDMVGGKGFFVKTEGELDEAINTALSQKDVPSLIEIVLNKNDHTDLLKRLFTNLSKKC